MQCPNVGLVARHTALWLGVDPLAGPTPRRGRFFLLIGDGRRGPLERGGTLPEAALILAAAGHPDITAPPIA